MRFKECGVYKHYKGNLYKVLYLSTHTSSNTIYVVYKSLEDKKVYIRPYYEFFSYVTKKGKHYGKPRFKRYPNRFKRFFKGIHNFIWDIYIYLRGY